MENEAILHLLTRAETCLESGQPRAAKYALEEILRRIGEEEQSDEFEDRLAYLTEQLDDITVNPPENRSFKDKPEYPACSKCAGSGRYLSFGRCLSCLGKGYQTPADTAREKDYWARREASAKNAEEITF